MRAELRLLADEIWVVDCSPEGFQLPVPTRVFQAVQQPVCIVMAVRSKNHSTASPAIVRYRALPQGQREEKFAHLQRISLFDDEWSLCAKTWRSSFLPSLNESWESYPALEDFFMDDGSGVMTGRTWIIAPDKESLGVRWQYLQQAPPDDRQELFHPHMRKGKLGDKHYFKPLKRGLPRHEARLMSVANDTGQVIEPTRYGFRTLDRQWIIPDARLINQSNPSLWEWHRREQLYITALREHAPTNGPATTCTNLIPDLHHYKGSFGGRVYPLLREDGNSNIQCAWVDFLSKFWARTVLPEDIFAYVVGVSSHSGYLKILGTNLFQPGLRIPVSDDPDTFFEVADLGRRLIWLYTFGDSMTDEEVGRPRGAPRARNPISMSMAGLIGREQDFPDSIRFDEESQRLYVGEGWLEGVDPRVWSYEVSKRNVLQHWFSYRGKDRNRTQIGERREDSKLGEIKPERWPPSYTDDLIDLVNVITLLIELEESAELLLKKVLAGGVITSEVLPPPVKIEPGAGRVPLQLGMFEDAL